MGCSVSKVNLKQKYSIRKCFHRMRAKDTFSSAVESNWNRIFIKNLYYIRTTQERPSILKWLHSTNDLWSKRECHTKYDDPRIFAFYRRGADRLVFLFSFFFTTQCIWEFRASFFFRKTKQEIYVRCALNTYAHS